MVLVDIHCHLLPGIDDGAKDWSISLQLAKDAVKDGITHAICTPHHLNGRFINHKQEVIKLTKEFQNKLNQAEIPLTVFPGQEIRLSEEILPALKNDDILFCDEERHYMLLEFPNDDVPSFAKQIVFKLKQQGITPIIVHPERNNKILQNPYVLENFLEQGCLVQITASSYTGIFGKKIQKLSRRLLQANQVTCFASDAHNLPNRQYQLSEALIKVKNEFDERKTKILKNNARAIINGDIVEFDWSPLKKKRRLWLFK